VNVQEEIDASAAACVPNTANVLSIGQRQLCFDIGRTASEESVLQLTKGNTYRFYYTILKHVSQKADLRSLDFVIDRLFMILFIGLTAWILSDNVTNFLALNFLPQLLIMLPNFNQN